MIYEVNNTTKEHRIVTPGKVRGIDVPPTPGWTYVHADADGWIAWEDGECPLPDGMSCQWRGEDGFVSEEIGAGCVSWINGHRRINAYRPILDAEPSELEATNRTPESAAIATLEKMGYGYFGGELWKPPLGERPARLDDEPEAVEWDGQSWPPPIGCRLTTKGTGHEAKVIAVEDGHVIGWCGETAVCGTLQQDHCRPLRTHAQRAEDEMLDSLPPTMQTDAVRMVCRTLYRAGYRKENNQ